MVCFVMEIDVFVLKGIISQEMKLLKKREAFRKCNYLSLINSEKKTRSLSVQGQ